MNRAIILTAVVVSSVALMVIGYFMWKPEAHSGVDVADQPVTLEQLGGSTAVAIHFDAWHDWHDAYEKLLANPEVRYINRVAVSAGRADWTYFRWPGNEKWWSSEQKATDTDMLEHTLGVLRQRGYATTAIFDVFGERYLTQYPAAAALDLDGKRSEMVICSTELAEGKAGNHLLNAVEALAATTQADTIAVTELFYDHHCYDDRCLQSYRNATGRADWPRTTAGRIDYLEPSVGNWRSQQVASITARLAKAVHDHGKKFALDVKISRDDITRNSVENGQDYRLLAPLVDEFVVWDYFATEGEPPESSAAVANYFSKEFGPDRFYLSIGLWDRVGVISGGTLARALRAAQEGGATQVWITPAEKMSTPHWKALAEAVRAVDPEVDASMSQP